MVQETQLRELEAKAGRIKPLLTFASRPFVVEFAGTPKAGKSTSVHAVSHFLRRNQFLVYVLEERASVCPIPMKGHLFFNTWCGCTMLAELLEHIETKADIIIKDRGLFDTLVWLQRQAQRGELTSDEVERIEGFMLMERWRRLVDFVVVSTVDANEALQREHANLISMKLGSIMNIEALTSINESVLVAANKYSSMFRFLGIYNTTGSSPRETNIRIASDILDHLERFLNPEIMVVPRSELESIPFQDGGNFDSSGRTALTELVRSKAQFVRRAEAEQRNDIVQIIPAAVLVNKGRIFLFQRAERDPKYQLYGKSSIWQGSHVPRGEASVYEELFTRALSEKVAENLHISRQFRSGFIGYAWDRDDPKSSRHLGLIYKMHIDSTDVASDLEKKEFRKGRGYGLFGKFVAPEKLASQREEVGLESWSTAVLLANGRVLV